ncbi:GMC family oxidoreductase N-terminal domain-containing protein [Sphingomonas psychrotolerans]|uniref:GMC family oxidoreductase N-terminal domain-containing protein n=1 Tax=Sphingomonas psychrotolerans TaxID=1327635 RepID=A0ABU3N7Y4_9SPHN|nr:GMC family oxidoreductase N-terminal domain-containing protein [Sphingomonas psychrotolerans]MDT8760391.1 GMC family oxidoreductase N-terminal domain-containing protein [Sphingomonas psychrotolerans]
MEEADIVVIGCGSGGSAVAGRLSEGGKYKVAVIEAGGRNTSLKTIMPGMMPFQTDKTNWRFETVPQAGLNGRRGYQPRGRGLGGSSAINAMLYIRGHQRDYDEWRDLGCTGWGWDDVLPWFRRSEHNTRGADAFHGEAGPLWVSDQNFAHRGSHAFIEAASRLQIPVNSDFNGARQDGVGLYQVTQKGGERWTAARAYLPTGKSDNLEILCDALVERILFEDGRACGVAWRQGGVARTIRARRAVVLAAGAFQTPQLLMLSGIGPGHHLAEIGLPVQVDRPAVGADLQDHIDYTAAFETEGSFFLGRSPLGTLKSVGALFRWLFTRSGGMTSPYAEAGGFLRTELADERPDVQLHFLIAIVEDHGRTKVKGHGYSCHACVLRPESRGTVRLASPDAAAAPLIDPNFLSDPRDMAVLKAGVRAMYRILETPPLADYRGRDRYPVDLSDDAALEQLIRARADTVYHPVGTARMGADADAVVDPRLKVRGVDGLYIADASVMPRLIGGNTNAPTIMIGERAAAFIAEDLR